MWDLKLNNGILETTEYPKYIPDSRGLGGFCFHKMKEFKNNIAQLNPESGETQTYGDILRDSIRCALEMQSLGIGVDDAVSLCLTTDAQTCIPFWATFFIGANIASLDPALPLEDVIHLTNIVKPKLIFCNPKCVELLEKAIKVNNLDCKLVVLGDLNKHLPFTNFLRPKENENNFKPYIPKDLFETGLFMFSSGTTGLQKAICLTHYGMLYLCNFTSDIFTFERSLFYSPPIWISYVVLTISILLQGGTRIMAGEFNPTKSVKYIQDFKVTFLFMSPTFTYALCNHEENSKYDTSSLLEMMVGGTSLPLEQMKRIQTLFPTTIINQLYGLTEISSFFSGLHTKYDFDLFKRKVGSAGKMLPGTQCKIVDIETNEVLDGPNKRGELLIKTKRVMKEYYTNKKATLDAFDEDGFLRTGDVVYYDEDYCFYIVDRIKEMFKYKSWHILPAELETILIKHPKIKEVLVIGYPNEVDGDHPMAVIVPKDGVHVTESEIIQYFNDQVDDVKRLRAGVKFVKSLPKTTTGKYSRRTLRNNIINNKILFI